MASQSTRWRGSGRFPSLSSARPSKRSGFARLAGARTIIACDLLDNKLAYARTFGATHTISAKLGDLVKQVQALTDGLGVDAAFDAIGGEATALQALDAVAPGGRAVLVGIPAFAVRA